MVAPSGTDTLCPSMVSSTIFFGSRLGRVSCTNVSAVAVIARSWVQVPRLAPLARDDRSLFVKAKALHRRLDGRVSSLAKPADRSILHPLPDLIEELELGLDPSAHLVARDPMQRLLLPNR